MRGTVCSSFLCAMREARRGDGVVRAYVRMRVVRGGGDGHAVQEITEGRMPRRTLFWGAGQKQRRCFKGNG